MKSAYILVGISLPRFLRVLKKQRKNWNLGPAFLHRFFLIFQNALLASSLVAKEKRKYKKIINDFQPTEDPVFIIGHWRTGSTLLHQLFQLDTSRSVPTHYQVILPELFISAAPFYRPVLPRLMGKTRPMDAMKLDLDQPQEDEYALLKLCGISPLNHLIFPDHEQYFLNPALDFIPGDKEIEDWEAAFDYFHKKLSWTTRKQIVYKNPFHSLRIPLLRKKFPKAKFVHIFRHPHQVVPSSIHLWKTVGSQNIMNNKKPMCDPASVSSFYNYMLYCIDEQKASIEKSNYTDISYETLTLDPVSAMQKIYKELGWEFTSEYQNAIEIFWSENINYKKNVHELTPDLMAEIDRNCPYYIKFARQGKN